MAFQVHSETAGIAYNGGGHDQDSSNKLLQVGNSFVG